jgi:hypothetical protein
MDLLARDQQLLFEFDLSDRVSPYHCQRVIYRT